MKVGASGRVMAFPEGFFPVEGFSAQLDDLHARVLVLEGERRCALAVLELTSIPPEEIEALQAIVREASGAEACWILASHTFSAPHFMPDHALKTGEERAKKRTLQELVYAAVREAAAEAAAGMTEAGLSLGQAACMVNSPRDVETPAGWWIACCGEGPVNHTLTALLLSDAERRPVAALVHYAVQSSVLDGCQLRAGGKPVSGDISGRMAASIEQELGCPVLFLTGAAGDQAPREKAVGFKWLEDGAMKPTNLQDDAIRVCDALAGELADAVREALAAAQPLSAEPLRWAERLAVLPAKQIERDLHRLHPTRIPPYVPDGETTQPVTLLQIGGLRLIGVRPELSCKTAMEICEGHPQALVVTLFNGGAKYLPEAGAYDRITYESQNSPFGRGAAERLACVARELLD
ncbi:MAG: hypothetical protein ACI4WX_08210 [Aristaeellaceae bacterium]